MSSLPQITIIGAGPAGCFMALLLAKRGFHVQIFERYSREEVTEKASGRSFNITFFKKGVEALQKAALFEDLKDYLIPLEGTVVHPTYSSDPVFLNYDATHSPYYAVRRAAVVEVLLKKTEEYPNIKIHFNSQLHAIDRSRKTMMIQNTRTKEFQTIHCSIIIGADGAHSQVRKYVYEGQNTEFTMEYESWRYKEVTLTAEMVASLGMKKNAMHIWSRSDALLASFPNPDFSHTAMLAVPSFDNLSNAEHIQTFIKTHFPDLLPAADQMIRNILNNPVGRLLSIHMKPWYADDFIVLIGDAVHAALPFQGQGMTAAFEDSLALADLIDERGTDWLSIFPLYQERRKKHVDVLVDVSQKSFGKILRHIRADYEAIYDRVDGLLHSIFPRYWHPPFYLMMSYYPQGFADILDIHQRQRKMARYVGIAAAVWTVTNTLRLFDAILAMVSTKK